MLEQALHETGGTALRESRRAVQNHADEEERDELRKIILDVRATAGAIGDKGKEHSMAVSYFHLVQRLESESTDDSDSDDDDDVKMEKIKGGIGVHFGTCT